MYTNGAEATDTNRFISDFINTSGISLLHLLPQGIPSPFTRIVFYNSKDASDINAVVLVSNNTVLNSNNAPYMRFAGLISNKDAFCVSEEYLTAYAQYGYKKSATQNDLNVVEDALNTVEQDVEEIKEMIVESYDYFGTRVDFSSYTNTATNAVARFSALASTQKGKLKTITLKVSGSGSATIYLGTYVGTTYTYVASFDVDLVSGVNTLTNGVDFNYDDAIPINTVIGVGSSNVSLYYLSTEGETSISINTSNVTGARTVNTNPYGVSINAEIILMAELDKIEEELKDIQTPKDVFSQITSVSLTNGSLIIDTVTAIKKKLNLAFFGTISAFNDLEVGYKYIASGSSTKYNRVAISDTDVVITTSVGSQTYQHGLTIENNIAVLIEMKINETADITIMSDGEIWKQNVSWFRMISIVSPYAEVSSTTILTDCKLSMNCEDYNKRVFAYGDSYFNYVPERWIYYAEQYGFTDNMLLDAHAGEASAAAVRALGEDIKHGTPKYILWCLGMNDSSDNSAAYATNWKAGIDAMISYCEQIHAIPILATVPTVATNGTVTRNNEKKNEWIRQSGYRYIDFAKAVGAGANGVWYEGMLEPTSGGITERVHPTAKGAKALFLQACVDFPEMMVTN